MDTSQANFHSEEYKQIRQEVGAALTRAEQLLKYGVVIAAAVFAWLATQSIGLGEGGKLCLKLPIEGNPLGVRIWWVPTVAVVVIGFIGGALFLRVREMGLYLRQIEDALGNQALGWEKFLGTRAPVVSIVSVLAWVVLLAATSYVACQMQEAIPTLQACPIAKS